jgi:hypothetical protein
MYRDRVVPDGHVNANGVWVFGRDEFRRHRFVYKPGQHAVFGGPSQVAGKTTLAFDLLEVVAKPTLPAWCVVSKPTDEVTERRGRELGYGAGRADNRAVHG